MSSNTEPQSQSEQETPTSKTRLVDIEITNQNEAFTMLIQFLSLAQNRGVYRFDESAKIWECLKYFKGVVQTEEKPVEENSN